MKTPKTHRLGILQQISAERNKQVTKGFDASHDDTHDTGQIADAASGVARYAIYAGTENVETAPDGWPWMRADWERIAKHPRRQMLVIATALLVAEIERIDRAAMRAAGKAK